MLGEMRVVLVTTATSVPLNIPISSVEISAVVENLVDGVFSSTIDGKKGLDRNVSIASEEPVVDSALGDCSFDDEVITIGNVIGNVKLDFGSAKVVEGAGDVVAVESRVFEGPMVV